MLKFSVMDLEHEPFSAGNGEQSSTIVVWGLHGTSLGRVWLVGYKCNIRGGLSSPGTKPRTWHWTRKGRWQFEKHCWRRLNAFWTIWMQFSETNFTQNLESESLGMVTKNVHFNKLPRDGKYMRLGSMGVSLNLSQRPKDSETPPKSKDMNPWDPKNFKTPARIWERCSQL